MPEGPITSFSVQGLSVSLWENESEGRKYKNVSVKRSFFNKKKNEYENQTITLSPSEIGCLAGLLRKMEEAVVQNGGKQASPF